MSSKRSATRALRSVVALTVLGVVSVLPACSDQVAIDVQGVDARWVHIPGPGDREALVVTSSEDEATSSAGALAQRPLFVVLHGAGQDAQLMTTFGGWSDVARDQHAVTAFAQGVDKSFNAGTCCGTASVRKIDDVAYLDRLIATVSKEVGADPARVYMVGFSNGAMMTYRYLCEGSVHLLGAASLAGTNVSGCTPTRPTPFLQVSGTKDDIVPIGDTPSVAVAQLGPLEPGDRAVRQVAEAFSCPPSRRTVLGAVTVTTWSPCAQGVTVRFDVVAGLVHMYPFDGSYSATQQALAMWGFR
ncbi:MAG: hypothetical protein JST64_07205 [Actinobacteria bacterium]|nr:hypothetical protein [Actinomycetota bacterium]